MPLSLTVSTPYVTIGSKAVFSAQGGVAPYTYSIKSGDGSIDSGGVFTATANDIGETVIKVVDSSGAIKTQSIKIVTFLHLIAHILKYEMGLSSDQVYIYNQKLFIPKDERIYISIGLESSKIIGAKSKFDNGVESRAVSNFNTIKIDLFSKSIDALIRKDEVIASLGGIFSQNVQTANSFRISTVPQSVTNLSQVDGTAIPFRFNLTFGVYNLSLSYKDVEYFDSVDIGFSSKDGDNAIMETE